MKRDVAYAKISRGFLEKLTGADIKRINAIINVRRPFRKSDSVKKFWVPNFDN